MSEITSSNGHSVHFLYSTVATLKPLSRKKSLIVGQCLPNALPVTKAPPWT